jgi:hypothetical protein
MRGTTPPLPIRLHGVVLSYKKKSTGSTLLLPNLLERQILAEVGSQQLCNEQRNVADCWYPFVLVSVAEENTL